MIITPENEKLQYSGRIDFTDKKAPILVYAASYVKLIFKGTSVGVEIANHRSCWTNQMGYFLDGKQGCITLSNSSERKLYAIANDLEDVQHELILFKRMDSCHIVTFYGFLLDDDAEIIMPTSKPKRRIEVFGDSVSCGEVSEAIDYVGKIDPEHDGEYSNSWYSYAWMTARMLGAELHNTSQGGIALLDNTGWFVAPNYKGMESCYDKIQYNPELGNVKKWDFSKYTPHIVIVAIGQNDSHPRDYMAEDYNSEQSLYWRKRYQEFIENLMKIYPKAQIILTTTILKHDKSWDYAIGEVCEKIGSNRVHHFLYSRNGAGTPGHIRISEAEEMAQELTTYIESLGEEIWQE